MTSNKYEQAINYERLWDKKTYNWTRSTLLSLSHNAWQRTGKQSYLSTITNFPTLINHMKQIMRKSCSVICSIFTSLKRGLHTYADDQLANMRSLIWEVHCFHVCPPKTLFRTIHHHMRTVQSTEDIHCPQSCKKKGCNELSIAAPSEYAQTTLLMMGTLYVKHVKRKSGSISG